MSWMTGKLIRSLSLVVLIITALAFCVLLWIAYATYPFMLVPAVGFTGIYVWVLLVELWGALVNVGGEKDTLSTRFKHWAMKHPVMAWISLGLFWIAMTALVVHLGVYW